MLFFLGGLHIQLLNKGRTYVTCCVTVLSLQDTMCRDCAFATCCVACSWCQMSREMKKRNISVVLVRTTNTWCLSCLIVTSRAVLYFNKPQPVRLLLKLHCRRKPLWERRDLTKVLTSLTEKLQQYKCRQCSSYCKLCLIYNCVITAWVYHQAACFIDVALLLFA